MDSSSLQEEQEEEPLGVRTSSPRRSSDVERLWRELTKSFPDHGGAAEASMLEVLQRIKEAEKNTEEETKLAEVEKILENIISMSRKYSQSDAALTLLQGSSFGSVQPFYQPFSPVTVADIWRSNGFCLANTETILYDACLSKESEKSLPVHSARSSSQALTKTQTRHEDGPKCDEELVTSNSAESGVQERDHTATKPQRYINNVSFLQLEVCETDILE